MLPRVVKWGVAALALIAVAVVVWRVAVWVTHPKVTQEQVREAVFARIQSESRQAFLVTGSLDVVGTATVSNTKTFLPNVLDLSLGTTRTTVRAPGRVSYGFDARRLEPDMVRLAGDTVHITLPPLQVWSAEPNLEQLEVETDVGWARSRSGSGEDTQRAAIAGIQKAIRAQGVRHLHDSVQPRVNTARALQDLLTPVVSALGIENPHFHFELSEGVSAEYGPDR